MLFLGDLEFEAREAKLDSSYLKEIAAEPRFRDIAGRLCLFKCECIDRAYVVSFLSCLYFRLLLGKMEKHCVSLLAFYPDIAERSLGRTDLFSNLNNAFAPFGKGLEQLGFLSF